MYTQAWMGLATDPQQIRCPSPLLIILFRNSSPRLQMTVSFKRKPMIVFFFSKLTQFTFWQNCVKHTVFNAYIVSINIMTMALVQNSPTHPLPLIHAHLTLTYL